MYINYYLVKLFINSFVYLDKFLKRFLQSMLTSPVLFLEEQYNYIDDKSIECRPHFKNVLKNKIKRDICAHNYESGLSHRLLVSRYLKFYKINKIRILYNETTRNPLNGSILCDFSKPTSS